MGKIAVKRLTRSDLTLFKWHFENINAGKQTAINLNAGIFINKLYPELPALVKQTGVTKFPVDLDIFGPGEAGKHSLSQLIVKGDKYKNWRLNGAVIHNPIESPSRYNCLAAHDYAIMEFSGKVPAEVKMVLISASLEEDRQLHAQLSELMGGRSMAALSSDELAGVRVNLASYDDCTALTPDLETFMEDAAQGGIVGQQNLAAWKSKRQVTRDELNHAKERASEIGLAGEEFVDYFLNQEIVAGRIHAYEWASRVNAIEAFDFKVNNSILIDVKSTAYSFNQRLHISLNELLHMLANNYHLYRIYDIRDRQAKLRICVNTFDLAEQSINILDTLPFGIKIDSISISPDNLVFGDEVIIEMLTRQSEG